jgi:hypothetical protein
MSAVSDACLVCGGTMVREVFAQNGYRVVACAHCGFEFVYPTPTVAQLAAYYDQSYAVPLARDANNVARHRAPRRIGALAARTRATAGSWLLLRPCWSSQSRLPGWAMN